MWTALNILIALTFFLGFFWVLRWRYMRDILPSKKYPQGRMLAEFWQETGQRPKVLVPIKANGKEIVAPTSHKKGSRYFLTRTAIGKTRYPSQPLLPFSFLQVEADICSWMEDCPIPINPRTQTESELVTTTAICPRCSHEYTIEELSSLLVATGEGVIQTPEAENTGADDVNSVVVVETGEVEARCSVCGEKSPITKWLNPYSLLESANQAVVSTMTAEGFAMLQDTDAVAFGQTINEQGAEELSIARANRLNKKYVYGLLIAAALAGVAAAIFAYQVYAQLAATAAPVVGG
jgi:hypothetical protein